ncbi:MAG: SH3 domain-containing protein [Synergistaceae bacterium]|nr:SH3 domain-containing protein [Synergistaceae bacterium]
MLRSLTINPMRKIIFAVLAFALFSSTALAADSDSEITFKGNITLNGKKINGSARVSLPEAKEFTTQDDSGIVMAMLFKREGYDKAKPDFTIRTSEPFTVSGSNINGVYRLQRTVKKGSLNSIGGDKAPYKIPARPGDYYIGINVTLDDEDEEEIDAAILQYIKISVVNDSFSDETDTKFPALGICTGSNVRLRNAPGTNSKVTGRADESDRLIILGAEILDGELWLMIDNPSGKGKAYITGRYVEVIDNESPVHKALINVRKTFGTTPAKTRILLGRPLRTSKGNDNTYDSKFIYKGCEVDYINDKLINIEITQRGWDFGGIQIGDSLQKVSNALGKPYSSYDNEQGLNYEYELYPDHIHVTFRKNLVTHIEWRMFGDPADYE